MCGYRRLQVCWRFLFVIRQLRRVSRNWEDYSGLIVLLLDYRDVESRRLQFFKHFYSFSS